MLLFSIGERFQRGHRVRITNPGGIAMNKLLAIAGAVLVLAAAANVQAADVPTEIKIGTLYASAGPFSSISIPEYIGFNVWVDQKNAEGGTFVKPFNKKIPLKIVSYDDQSNT